MAKIKVYELAKEIDKHSKDIINYLKDQGIEVKSHMNSIEDNSVEIVKKHFLPQANNVENKETNQTVSKMDTPAQPVGQNHSNGTTGNRENRPNSNYQGNRPNNNNQGQGNRPNNNYQGNRPNNNYQGQGNNNRYGNSNNSNSNAGTSNGTAGTQGSWQGNRTGEGQRSGDSNYQGGGNRPNNYNQNRPNNNNQSNGGYRQNRPMNADGTRPQGTGERTGYQGNSERTGYQGNRTGYQGNSERTGYQGNNERTGYQGNGERTGYQGNGNGERTGYQGNRPNNQGTGGNRPYGGGQGTQGGNRPYGGGQGTQGGNRPYGQGQGQGTGGNRPYGGGQGTGGNRPYGQGQGQGTGGNRPYGQGQGTQGGNRPYGGGQGTQGGNRPYGQGTQGGNRPYGGGNQGGGYKPRGFGDMNKDDDKDSDNKKRGFRGNDSKSTEKKFDTPLGMSRSDSVNNRNRANKNVKPTKNNYGRKVVDKDQLGDGIISNKKGQFIKPKPIAQKVEEAVKVIEIPEILTIKELADKMKFPAAALVKKLFLAGKMVSLNQEITFEEAEEIALEYDIIAEHEVVVDVIEELLKEDDEDEANMVKRPPVVCVMGHVDHGKTSLLDAIRTTSVTTHEAGGITQHIGAYQVDIKGEVITFLDTPGHEAFTSMRMRGAKSTDIAILVVAADDGVMPQTVEAISHAKAAGIQIIVAINKVDKPSANIERVKQELTEYELLAEDWGGDTIFVPVSAHTKEGIEQLLEMIVLTAEIGELRANPNRNARGIVIEAELDKGRGPVATILVQKGTLHVGDSIAIGAAYGKVRAMMDDKGKRVKEATPSTPVEILGLNEVPDAGEIFTATDTEKEARAISETYISQGRERLLADTKSKLSLDGLFSQIKAGNVKELNLIIKADVQGSVEAMKQSLTKLSNAEVAVRIIHGGVGAINESDVTLASASNAIIIGFNVRPDNAAKETADREKVDLRLYRVIYSAIEDVDAAMKGMLDPVFEEKVIGHAEVRQVFKASGLGTIAGSYVLDGKITRGCSARITREGKLIFEGALASVKRFKDDVKEVASGYECGLVFEKFNEINEFDQVELYVMQEVPRK